MRKYDSYKDSGVEWIGEIPSGWNLKKLKELFENRNEKNDDLCEDFLSITKDRGVIPYSEKGNVGNNTSEDIGKYKKVYPQDIVVNPMNIIIGSVGVSKYNGVLSNVYIVLKPTKILSGYGSYIFHHKSFQLHLKKICYGIMELRESLNKIEFFVEKLPLPPLSEQQQIVSFLDTKTSQIDSLIEKTQRKIELLKEKRTSLINEVVTKGLNPNVEMKDSGVKWIGEIPSHWEKSKLKYKGQFFSGYSFDSNDFLTEGEIRVLKISNIQNNGISWEDLQYLPNSFYDNFENFRVNKGDLVFVLTRPIISTGIKVCFFEEDYKTLLNQRNSVFRPNKFEVVKRFLFYSVRTFSFVEEFKQQLKETNQPNISTEQISNILMFFPPLSEQNEIVSYLDEHTQLIDKTISIEEKRIELLKEYRQSLISEVVTGKRKVTTNE